MSWSESFEGTPEECLSSAKARKPDIEAGLPLFEQDDVGNAIAAVEVLLAGIAEDAKVHLSLSGHGFRLDPASEGDSIGGGSIAVSMSYSVPKL